MVLLIFQHQPINNNEKLPNGIINWQSGFKMSNIKKTLKRRFKCCQTMGIPGLFFVYSRSFQTNISTILQQINVKKCRSSKWHLDLNPRPLEHESPPITTRPGLPPKTVDICLKKLSKAELKPESSGVGSNHSSNCAITL